jgi:transketolase
MSHQATEDIAIMRSLPDVTVVCPGDLVEAAEATKAIINISGTVYMRLGRGGEKRIHDHINDFKIGKAIKIQNAKTDCKKKVALLSTGAILDEATEATKMLEKLGIGVEEYSFHTVKPIDRNVIIDCASRYDYIVTVEEHNTIGGFASAVSEVITDTDVNVRLIKIGLNDEYCSKVGDQKYLRGQYGMIADNIVEKVMREMM